MISTVILLSFSFLCCRIRFLSARKALIFSLSRLYSIRSAYNWAFLVTLYFTPLGYTKSKFVTFLLFYIPVSQETNEVVYVMAKVYEMVTVETFYIDHYIDQLKKNKEGDS